MATRAREAADQSLRVLIVSADPALGEEFKSALSGVPDRQGSIYLADTPRDAVDLAGRRQPNLIVIEVAGDIGEIGTLSRDLQDIVPDAAIAGAFRPDRLDQGLSESATIIELLRAQMRDFLRRPLSATELRAVLDRLFSRTPAAVTTHGRVASFLSNKGGVGKSTLAVNVACALAQRHPDEVLLIDTSLQLGTCAFMLDLRPTTSLVDAVRERDRLDRTLLRHLALRHASGLRVLAAPADALEGAEVDDEAIARIVNMARRSFRHVVVDTFPVLDNVLMAVLDLTDVGFVVTQGTAPAVAGLARFLPVLEGLGFPVARQRLVLNHNYHPFLGDLKPRDVSERLQRTISHLVPYEKKVLVSMNTGVPEVLNAGRWQGFGRAVRRIVDELDNVNPAATPPAPAVEITTDRTAPEAAADTPAAGGLGLRGR